MADRHVGLGQAYSTPDEALSAASDGDTIYLHQNTDGSYIYSGSKILLGTLDKTVTIIGYEDDQKITIFNGGDSNCRWRVFSSSKHPVLQNLTLCPAPSLHEGNITARNCRVLDGYQQGVTLPGVVGHEGTTNTSNAYFENCIMVGTAQVISATMENKTIYCRNCTLVGGEKSYGGIDYKVVDAWNGDVVLNNCVVIGHGDNQCCEVRSGGSIAGDYNIGTDDTIPGENSTVEADVSEYSFQQDFDTHNLFDFRTRPGSCAEGAGTDLSGTSAFLANDIDGRERSSWDCGASEGFTGWTDYPERASVLASDTVDGEAGLLPLASVLSNDGGTLSEDNVLESAGGNYHETEVDEVKLDVTFGPSGGYTGTYNPAGDPPETPTLTFSDNGDGTGAVATVADSSDATTNTIYYAQYGSTDWTEGGSRTADGTVDLSIATIGKYWGYIHSENAGGVSVSSIVTFNVTTSDVAALPARAYPRKRGPWVTLYLTSDNAWAYEALQLLVKRLGRHRDG